MHTFIAAAAALAISTNPLAADDMAAVTEPNEPQPVVQEADDAQLAQVEVSDEVIRQVTAMVLARIEAEREAKREANREFWENLHDK